MNRLLRLNVLQTMAREIWRQLRARDIIIPVEENSDK